MKRRLATGFMSLVFITGIGCLLYPKISDLISRLTSTVEITDYDQAVAEIDDAELKERKAQAVSYNQMLAGRNSQEALNGKYGGQEEYEAVLDVGGISGYIEIPGIDVYLPIYNKTDEKLLQKGVCHLEGTSLPIGGESTHCVLSGHTGLPSAELLTDLDQMEPGDIFYLHVLDETSAYQVDQIKVVLPGEAEDLQIIEGKDYTTLVTCTPYGVNDHRLLVRGERIPYVQEDLLVTAGKKQTEVPDQLQILILIGAATLCVGIVIAAIVIRNRKRR